MKLSGPAMLASGAAAIAMVASATAHAGTYANPIDIDYRYNWEQVREGISYRTGADPVVVPHKGRFYLFQTLADGYWVSDDLVDWRFVKPNLWPFDSMVAPAAWSDGETLYLKRSQMVPNAVLSSRDPASGQWEFFTRLTEPVPNAVRESELYRIKDGQLPPGPWDPSFFRDDDGRWYFYWGSSNVYPLYGSEVDRDRGFAFVGEPQVMMALHPDRYGWERFGQDHRSEIKPFTEGAWVNKIQGRYYFQYGAPGTEYNVYATGLYTADKPLGPYRYAPWNPIGYKPGGFVNGAGHGSAFQDRAGNWWLTGTPWIGNNWNFERRVGMWPMRLWPDGEWSATTRFGDFPHRMPTVGVTDPNDLFTGWMLLSYRKFATASSTTADFAAGRVTDENPRTFWVAGANRPGETLTVDLGATRTVRAVQVNFADYRSGLYGDAPNIYTEFRLEGSADGRRWRPIARTEPPRRDRPNAYFELRQPETLRYVRYVHGHVGAATLAISDLRVFGNAGAGAPAAPVIAAARRHRDDRDATVTWRAVPGAVGYNVRWGIRPDRLSQTYQRWGDQGTALEIRALTKGQSYYVAVEAFDERGVSGLSRVLPM